jgi:hypothetical protein
MNKKIWLSYTETRAREILNAAEINDWERVLDLVRHHLGTGSRDIEGGCGPDDTFPKLAHRVLVRRVLPAMLALVIISERHPYDDAS